MTPDDLLRHLESLLFVSAEPADIAQLGAALDVPVSEIESALDEFSERCKWRGIRVQRKGQRVQLASAPDAAPYVEKYLGLNALTRLSQAALETLAIIAYRQPITRPEIEVLRGVDSDGVLRTLTARQLIIEVGRLDTVGHPIRYGTTFEFLRYFGLERLDQLPSLTSGEPAAALAGVERSFTPEAGTAGAGSEEQFTDEYQDTPRDAFQDTRHISAHDGTEPEPDLPATPVSHRHGEHDALAETVRTAADGESLASGPSAKSDHGDTGQARGTEYAEHEHGDPGPATQLERAEHEHGAAGQVAQLGQAEHEHSDAGQARDLGQAARGDERRAAEVRRADDEHGVAGRIDPSGHTVPESGNEEQSSELEHAEHGGQGSVGPTGHTVPESRNASVAARQGHPEHGEAGYAAQPVESEPGSGSIERIESDGANAVATSEERGPGAEYAQSGHGVEAPVTKAEPAAEPVSAKPATPIEPHTAGPEHAVGPVFAKPEPATEPTNARSEPSVESPSAKPADAAEPPRRIG